MYSYRMPDQSEVIPVVLFCPHCKLQHVDEGKWKTKPHRTHACVDNVLGKGCGKPFTPSAHRTVGVQQNELVFRSIDERVGVLEQQVASLQTAAPRGFGHGIATPIGANTAAEALRASSRADLDSQVSRLTWRALSYCPPDLTDALRDALKEQDRRRAIPKPEGLTPARDELGIRPFGTKPILGPGEHE